MRAAQFLHQLRFPAIASLLLLLPFVLLEVANRRSYQEGFPFPLFAILWLLQLAFMLLLKPVLQAARLGRIADQPGRLFVCAACLLLIGWLWASMMADQLPCFLGAINCD